MYSVTVSLLLPRTIATDAIIRATMAVSLLEQLQLYIGHLSYHEMKIYIYCCYHCHYYNVLTGPAGPGSRLRTWVSRSAEAPLPTITMLPHPVNNRSNHDQHCCIAFYEVNMLRHQ